MYAVFQTRRFGDITIRYIWSNSFISAFDTIRYYRDSLPFDAIGYCDLTRSHCTVLARRDWKIALKKLKNITWYRKITENNRRGNRRKNFCEWGRQKFRTADARRISGKRWPILARICWILGLRIRNPGFEVARRTRRNPRNFIDLSITARQRRREYGNRATPTHRGEPPWLLAPFVFKRVASSTRIFAETVTIPRQL